MRKSELKALAEKIKKLRKVKRMTQVELAVAIGLSPSYVAAIEQATRQPSLKTLKKLARVLGTRVTDLIDF
ncbi:MAG: Transcriptional regulator, XRE family [Candidatus Curtissbacteria bacterium GW2011_GWA1_40_16]|uniref:Transcriptional regulator, XRE family n=1 Tax=Candidatus Curtissbacteria bacterium GW2011_GWA1_40_16 TaxID=1618405 RepID=A0A0G0UHN0_9BACT|nr:MAG: Transcriptional regulator, XRE family [Candidatus Curtissbacteria bacterium GW2011_GWA1_40_16]